MGKEKEVGVGRGKRKEGGGVGMRKGRGNSLWRGRMWSEGLGKGEREGEILGVVGKRSVEGGGLWWSGG